MGKRKKQNQWEDWDDEPDDLDMQDMTGMDGGDAPHVSKHDFTITEKVQAFVEAYEPCREFDPGYEAFNDARLREYFKGYTFGLGDPMKMYIGDLKMAGFQMAVSIVSDEPCIFCRRKGI